LRRGLVTAACLALGWTATPAIAQIVSNNFEDGSTQGWGPRGSAVVATSTDVAHGGSRSLKVTGRTASWNGPATDLRSQLSVNTAYQISGWVRLVAGQPASNLKFTVEERTTGSTSSTFVQVNAATAVTDSGWVQLQGTFSFTSAANDTLTLYLESDDPTSAYYLDDFAIAGPSGDQTGLMTGFESGTAEGWTPRGPVTLTPTTETSATGGFSLKVTGRTASWQGPTIDVLGKLSKGTQYAIGVRVRLAPGEGSASVRVSLQADFAGNTSFLTVIGDTVVTDAAWVDLSAMYTFGADADHLQLYVETASGTPSFYIDDFLLDPVIGPPIQALPALKDVLADDFDVGTAVEPAELFGRHSELLLRHFNSIVAGNAMKWGPIEPQEGVYNFGPADAIAQFARDHGLKMRGHTLVWHNQNPAWLFQRTDGTPMQPGNPDDRALLIQRLQNHIHTVVARYADVVDYWDVVNEVVDASQPNGLRNSLWLQIIGPEYIDLAFQFAAEVPHAGGLYINDYNTDDAAKRTALLNIVRGLLQRGIRVDGVGHQMHINVEWPPLSQVAASLDAVTALGLDNQITELDMSAYTNSTDTSPVTSETLTEQGYRYRDLFNLLRSKSSQISSVTFWGLADDNTWLKTTPITRDDKPLLFDEQLQAKPAYWGIVDPSQLPVLRQDLNVTQQPGRGLLATLASWAAVAPVPLNPGDGSNSWGEFQALWSPGALHLAVSVTDSTRMRGDTIEVFLGGGLHYTFSGYGFRRSSGASGLLTPTRDGYLLIATVPVAPALSVGGEVSFDLRVTDGSTGRQQSWSDTHHAQQIDESGFGTLHLLPKKNVVPVGRGRPTIDGQVDRVWKHATEIVTTRSAFGTPGATAHIKLLWNSGYLYILATVADPNLSKASPNPWEQDSVEVFVDPNNAQSTTYQADDGQYRVNFDNAVSFGGAASASSLVSATRIVPGGYIVEAAIRVDPATTKRGSILGFDFQVNDDAGGGTRTSVATWNDISGLDFQDTTHFGAIILK
jgi:endo-1,4-beta-xylanase